MCDLVDQEPNNYEQDAHKKEWVEEMTKEYQLIVKNDVWDIVPKPKKQEYGIFEMDLQDKNMLRMEVLKSTKQDLWLDDSLTNKESIMKRTLL